MNFEDLKLRTALLKNIAQLGYSVPTPIQEEGIPFILAGHDLLGIAQTGTGKTAAFCLPIIEKLMSDDGKGLRALVIAPTRELVSQIHASFENYGKDLGLKSAAIFGGVDQKPQVKAIREGLDIIVATPGRLLDLLEQEHLRLSKVLVLVMDEADRMLDMGFINDIRKIIPKLPPKKQTLLFSATMPPEIASLAAKLLHQPKRVEVTPPSTTVERINQRLIYCRKIDKYQLLRKIINEESTELTLVFTRTKHGANKIVDYLHHHQISCAAIHGNKSQSARELALENFKSGKIKVLIATDIAARGIDVQGVSHVVNYDVPVEAESYVHRIGRTARAGKDGDAITFCDDTESDAMKRIEKLIKMKLPSENFVGVPEQGPAKTTERFRDPRATQNRGPRQEQKPRGERTERTERPPGQNQAPPRRSVGNTNQEPRKPEDNKKPKVGFKFRNRK